MGTLFYSLGHASQDAEKSLDIKRYPNEPLELVDLKLGQISVKNGIKFKSKEDISKWGLDNVKFKDKDDWCKKVKVRLRNLSGSPIYGLSASLYFKHPGLRMLFALPLTVTPSRDLKKQPLQPRGEIDLEVTEESFNQTMLSMKQYGVDPYVLPTSLSVDGAIFSDDFEWSRGTFLRRDPNNPGKWDAVDKPAPPGASRLKQPAGFTLISFKAVSYPPQQILLSVKRPRAGLLVRNAALTQMTAGVG